MVVKNILESINSAQELLTNPSKLQALFKDIGAKTWGEVVETGDMLEILWKMSLNIEVSEDEKKRAYEQAKDLAKTIPAFGIFLLPGGMILLPLIAKIIPWEILPSQFSNKKESVDESSSDNRDNKNNTQK